jgi:phospholipase C
MLPSRGTRVVWLAALLGALVACSNTVSSPIPHATMTPIGATPPPTAKVQHIVFIVQENRTVDNLFGGPHPFPGADTATSGETSSGGTVQLDQIALECTHILHPSQCEQQDPNNFHQPWLAACNAPTSPPFPVGQPAPCAMNGFDKNEGGLDPGTVYSYVERSETKPYWDIARAYALGDHFFMGHNSESYTAHQYIFSSQSNNVVDAPAYPLPTPAPELQFITPWGCDSPAGTTTFFLDPTSGEESQKPTGPAPCFSYHSLADLVNAKSTLSWRLYAYSLCQSINALDVNKSIRNSSQWPKNDSDCPNINPVDATNFRMPEDTFLTDVAGSKSVPAALASVTWVLPGPITSDHPGVPFGYCGPWWVANVVDAIGKSPFWKNTIVFVLWDDWGGFYDHVKPYVVRDVAGPGYRVPLLVVSPFAKRGVVVHTNAEFGTLMQFTEKTFGLGSLGATDASPYLNNLNDFFDFSSAKPFVPIDIPGSIVCNDTLRTRAGAARNSKWLHMIGDRD